MRRKTTGTGRMRYMKDLTRRFKNGFREGASLRNRHSLLCNPHICASLPPCYLHKPYSASAVAIALSLHRYVACIPSDISHCFLFQCTLLLQGPSHLHR